MSDTVSRTPHAALAGARPLDRPRGAAYRTAMATAVVVVAPLLLVAGRGLMMLPSARGFTALWNVAHVIFLAGTVLMIPAALAVSHLARDRAAPWLRDLGVALVFAGALALAAQFVVDLAVAVLASGDQQVGGALFDQLQASAPVNVVLYLVGPSIMFVGLTVQALALLPALAPRRWPAILLLVAPFVVGSGRAIDGTLVELAGLALIAVALSAVALAPATTTARGT